MNFGVSEEAELYIGRILADLDGCPDLKSFLAEIALGLLEKVIPDLPQRDVIWVEAEISKLLSKIRDM
ncbi:MAG: hypothetical protein QW136_00055 [Nitrososphaerales archaeon]